MMKTIIAKELLSHLDVLPLCLAAAGLPLPEDRVLDGRNPLATLSGEAKSPHRHLMFNYHNRSGLREGNLKLVRPNPKKPGSFTISPPIPANRRTSPLSAGLMWRDSMPRFKTGWWR